MRYLINHTKSFFVERTVGDGAQIWNQLYPSAVFVLPHPNGWYLKEQATLRRAAIQAGLVTESDSQDRVVFVTEAEASIHFCLHKADLNRTLKVCCGAPRFVFQLTHGHLFTAPR